MKLNFIKIIMIIANILNFYLSENIQNLKSLKEYFQNAKSFDEIEKIVISGEMVLKKFLIIYR